MDLSAAKAPLSPPEPGPDDWSVAPDVGPSDSGAPVGDLGGRNFPRCPDILSGGVSLKSGGLIIKPTTWYLLLGGFFQDLVSK